MKIFGIVSKSVMTNTSLSAEAKALYALLSCYCNVERVCFPSTTTLAKLLGKSVATVYRLLAELERNDILVKVRQGQKRIILMKDQSKAGRQIDHSKKMTA